MTIYFDYDKRQVLQGLRYHFITRPEIKTMLILVNIFALVSLLLYSFNKITPFAFLVGSTLWVVLMVSFWYLLPGIVYRRAETFKHEFSMSFNDDEFMLTHEKGSRSWPWKALASFRESPHFFHLYFDLRSFLLVPKSGCKEPGQVKELRDILQEKIKG